MSRGRVYMNKKCGIYIIKNSINNKVYIGQSVNIEARWLAHKYSATNVKSNDHHTQIHKAMYNLGVDNFFYEVLELCEIDELNVKEIFYIEKFNSYRQGYNMTLGGESNKYESNGRAILTLEQVQEIRLMYGARIRFKDAYARYENVISKRGFKKVWHYETWRGVYPEVYSDENKKWHATQAKKSLDGNKNAGKNNTLRACSNEEICRMRELRQAGLSYEKISKEVSRSTSVVRKYCLHREAIDPQAKGKNKPNSITVRNIETGIVFDSLQQAAAWAGITDTKHLKKSAEDRTNFFSSGVVPSTGQRCHWEYA